MIKIDLISKGYGISMLRNARRQLRILTKQSTQSEYGSQAKYQFDFIL
jgi:hypothetical protein